MSEYMSRLLNTAVSVPLKVGDLIMLRSIIGGANPGDISMLVAHSRTGGPLVDLLGITPEQAHELHASVVHGEFVSLAVYGILEACQVALSGLKNDHNLDAWRASVEKIKPSQILRKAADIAAEGRLLGCPALASAAAELGATDTEKDAAKEYFERLRPKNRAPKDPWFSLASAEDPAQLSAPVVEKRVAALRAAAMLAELEGR